MKDLFRVIVVALFLTASCSRELSASEARQRADEFAASQYNLTDFRLVKVETAERRTIWVVAYSAKGNVIGGPLIIGVDKGSGRAYLIGGGQ